LSRFNAPTVGAILSSGIITSPNKGYGPDNVLTSYSQFEHIIKVNLLGTFCVAQKVSQILLKNEPMDEDGERGIIITVSSILGLDGVLVGYGTSKAGVAGLTLPLAKELSPFGIRVMSIAPGPFGKKMKK
jgi:3-hydroxyacyl-CoA dehydrogenase/3-hydroxy-2-methylbutyryl-CoA dehydrogenase